MIDVKYDKVFMGDDDDSEEADALFFKGSALNSAHAEEHLSSLVNALAHLRGYEAMALLSKDWDDFLDVARQHPRKTHGVFIGDSTLSWSQLKVKGGALA